ncbi:MAG: hypothetical protein PVG20_04330 [Thioalkalispiraceae bacterium]|jgi:hypothetical protein
MKMRSMPEFFNTWCLSAVVVFGLNNYIWKYQYHNWLTGKLSDLTLCFFLPLFLSAILSLVTAWSLKLRLALGSSLTALVFTLVKTSTPISEYMNIALSSITNATGFGASYNIADSTDLVALPMIAVAWLYASNFMRKRNETQFCI